LEISPQQLGLNFTNQLENAFMKHTSLALITALICLAVTPVVQRANAQPPVTASRIADLSDFIGNGPCTGNVMASDKTPGHASVGHFHGEKILDGNWVIIHYDEDQTAENQKPYHVVQFFGFDSTKQKFVSVVFDNSGTTYGTGTSAGWKDDTLTIEDSTGGDSASYRDVFTRNGKKGLSHTGTMADKQGKWVKTDEQTCRITP
ncbi:MAG: DUF1579 family protein, partial [Rudaea sp.]